MIYFSKIKALFCVRSSVNTFCSLSESEPYMLKVKPRPLWLPGSPTPDSHLIAIEDVKKPQNPLALFHLASERCVGYRKQPL